MSLYNMLFGVHPIAGPLLAALEIDFRTIDRFRDAFLVMDKDEVVVHILCRTGGLNREDYRNEVLISHPLYIRDEDDDFDNTFAHYYFKVPEVVKTEAEAAGHKLEEFVVETTLKEMFDGAIEQLKTASKTD